MYVICIWFILINEIRDGINYKLDSVERIAGIQMFKVGKHKTGYMEYNFSMKHKPLKN